jgi:DNA helicase-2/ATP-dependent DNA helicase PcrA
VAAADHDLIETLWKRFSFQPNPNQRDAILHTEGPLFLPAGPGSGKTRVLLWRVTNLIVGHGLDPREVYLATFTEKAALQLREGLRSILAAATEETGRPYDLARMYIGTVHALAQRMLVERDFQPDRRRARAPTLLDELDQYLLVNQSRTWQQLLVAGGYEKGEAHGAINTYFGNPSRAKHHAASNCMAFFNRLSEECIDPSKIDTSKDSDLARLVAMYSEYLALLRGDRRKLTDFSLLQQDALSLLERHQPTESFFRHVIIDEYQDTNTVQERIFFRLARGHKNICVVGDDDQALYRFRGATVENFVQFPDRCRRSLGLAPREIPLDTNYRSRANIVGFYDNFMKQCDWRRPGTRGGAYRLESKQIQPFRRGTDPAVVATTGAAPALVCDEIAALVAQLIASGKIADPNQIAFLYPSLKSEQVQRMIGALERIGLKVYAPRAKSFLETPEATDILGLFAVILGRPQRGAYLGEYKNYYDWLDHAEARGRQLAQAHPLLLSFVKDRRAEVDTATADYQRLLDFVATKRWDVDESYDPKTQKRGLAETPGLSEAARRRIGSARFNYAVDRRIREGVPLKLKYVLKRATSVEWSLLDLFYQLTLFEHFGVMFDAAQRTTDPDEGPVCNLALLTGYISRFMEQRAPTVAGDLLREGSLQRMFFGSYLYALHRRGESEFEDAEDPFPKGRLPFLTIHQAKGLEFPIVVLGNPRKQKRLQRTEEIVYGLLEASDDREPLDRIPEFDTMRMFYVALSRAKNLLVIANFQSRGNYINDEFKSLVVKLPIAAKLDVGSVPKAESEKQETPRIYSYTGDFMAYKRCPRQYLIFRRFDFVPSRSQTMIFGTLVHRTLDDLHQILIGARAAGPAAIL